MAITGLEPWYSCHESFTPKSKTMIVIGAGLAGAPKFKDKADWAPRIADGMDLLVKRAIEGYKAMPPKGSCSTCSDEEIKKAVEYMVSNAQ